MPAADDSFAVLLGDNAEYVLGDDETGATVGLVVGAVSVTGQTVVEMAMVDVIT